MSPLTFTASTIVNPAWSCWNSTRGGTICLVACFAAATGFVDFAGAVLTGADDEHAPTSSAAASTRRTLLRGCIGPSRDCAQRRRSANRSRRAIRIAIDRAQEPAADLRLRIAARHHHGQAREALLDPGVVEV